MSLGTTLVIILWILVLLGVIPSWRYRNSAGYGPGVILLALGRI